LAFQWGRIYSINIDVNVGELLSIMVEEGNQGAGLMPLPVKDAEDVLNKISNP